MKLKYPKLRFWPTMFAVIASYPLSGFVFGLWKAIHFIFLERPHPIAISAISTILLGPWLWAFATPLSLGFPMLTLDSSGRINLYPLIFPIALLLVARTSGMIGSAPLNRRSALRAFLLFPDDSNRYEIRQHYESDQNSTSEEPHLPLDS